MAPAARRRGQRARHRVRARRHDLQERVALLLVLRRGGVALLLGQPLLLLLRDPVRLCILLELGLLFLALWLAWLLLLSLGPGLLASERLRLL